MARLKIDYGIDLGTTNSAICRMEKGKPIIKKIETTDDTMPSCVYFTKRKGIVVGSSAYHSMKSDKRRATKSWSSGSSNTYVEVKRTMGTDKLYESSNMGRSYSSEELSAEILKALKSYITDEEFNSVVITVPAKFTANQKSATMEAARLAGFEHCELLQEPIAAAMAYGLGSDEKEGYWMVFDFGGGTFDAALLKVEDGVIQVFDTEGDNYLGGKNLDYAIVDEIIIPYLKQNYSIDGLLSAPKTKEVLRDALKTYAEEIKNQLSFKQSEDIISNLGDLGVDDDEEEIELDLTLTQDQVFDVMRPIFQKAVDICKKLLQRNSMGNDQIDRLILVGGPTHSPLIRRMLHDQISKNIDYSTDPMTAVATGAAIYASTRDSVLSDDKIKGDTVRLDVDFESTTVDTVGWVTIKCKDSLLNNIYVKFTRDDHAWVSENICIEDGGTPIQLSLVENKANSFAITIYDGFGRRLSVFPEEITITQGIKIGNAPLPYHIGIAVRDLVRGKDIFVPARGLEKNKPLPAVGTINNRTTTSDLRPGVESDILRIPVYQADEYSEGTNARLYEHVADVRITGADIRDYVPVGSLVDLTLRVDSSEMMIVEAFFQSTSETVEKNLDITKVTILEEESKTQEDLISAERTLRDLAHDGANVSDLIDRLNHIKTEIRNNTEPKMVHQHLKEEIRHIELREREFEWTRTEAKLRKEFRELEEDQRKYGDEQSARMIDEFRRQMDQVIRIQDVDSATALTRQIRGLDMNLARIEYYKSYVMYWNQNFSMIRWTDAGRARQLINMAISLIGNKASVDEFEPLINEIMGLQEETPMPINKGGGLLS